MKNPLRLNDYNVHRNPPAGSHDPSVMWDPVTEKYYSYSTDVYGPAIGTDALIGIPVRSSPDLLRFRYESGAVLSPAAIAQGRDNGSYPPTGNFWAPYAEYVRGEYRLYYSATRAFGSSESRIWLCVSDNPLGPFENRGIVADTWGTDDSFPNAIDPHVVWSEGRSWLVYGSFFGGIYIKELCSETGLPLEDPRALGTCISRKSSPPLIDGPEGAAVIFVPETGYYYLFQSYGWLGDGYDIRVGRSRHVTGPYTDREGADLAGGALGQKLAGSYRFTASQPPAGADNPHWQWAGFRGPGHGVPFFDPVSRSYFFVHHIRDGTACLGHPDQDGQRMSYQQHYLMVRQMSFLDGWPVLCPEPYTEGTRTVSLTPEQAAGLWELIFFEQENNDQCESVLLSLNAEAPLLKNAVFHLCGDFENGGEVLTLTGFDSRSRAVWGKRVTHE